MIKYRSFYIKRCLNKSWYWTQKYTYLRCSIKVGMFICFELSPIIWINFSTFKYTALGNTHQRRQYSNNHNKETELLLYRLLNLVTVSTCHSPFSCIQQQQQQQQTQQQYEFTVYFSHLCSTIKIQTYTQNSKTWTQPVNIKAVVINVLNIFANQFFISNA